MQADVIEAMIHSTLDRLSNSEEVHVEDKWIEEAGEQFKEALRKQVTPRDRDFRIRMSNIGRPLCQLQMEKSGAEKSRMPYNFITRMLMGDAAEVIARFFLKAAGVDVTSHGDRVELDVAGTTIKGDSDLDIDGEVYDVKSASQWSYANKWSKGYRGLAESDSFGYVGQLFGYADAQNKKPGGWIVMDKSNGYVSVVKVEADKAEAERIRFNRSNVVTSVTEDLPFERCFTPVKEYFRKKPTGAEKLGVACSFCDYKAACWPTLQQLTPHMSKSASPAFHWYVKHPDMEGVECD